MTDLTTMKIYAASHTVPIMKDEGISFICGWIKDHGVRKILEIGTAIGYSAIQFASVSDDVHVTTIEIDIDREIQAVENVKKHGLEDRIRLIYADAVTCHVEGKFDLIFIDGPKAQYIKFFEKYKENLAEGGVIISDNLSFHGMVDDLSLTHNYSTKKLVKKIRKYVDFLRQNQEFTTEFHEIGDRIAVSRKK